MKDLLNSPLFMMYLNLLEIENAVIYGTTDLSRLVYEKMKECGIKILCFIDNESIKRKIGKTSVVGISDCKRYKNAQMVFITTLPWQESKGLIYEIGRKMNAEGGRKVAFLSGVLGAIYPLIKFGSQLSYLKKNKNIGIHLFNRYSSDDFAGLPEIEKPIYKDAAIYSKDYIEEVYCFHNIIKAEQGIRHIDKRGTYLNIINGKRYTKDVPNQYVTTVHLFGDCNIFGYGIEDNFTIASQVQNLLNHHKKNYYRVINHGIQGVDILSDLSYCLVENTLINDGDTLIFMYDSSLYMKGYFPFFKAFYQYLEIEFHDMYQGFTKERETYPDKILYIDKVHLSYDGMELVSKTFAEALKIQTEWE